MHIITYKIRHFQFQIAMTKCYILHDSSHGMPHHGLSGEACLGWYTGEVNPAHAQNAADSETFCKMYIQHATPKIGLTLQKWPPLSSDSWNQKLDSICTCIQCHMPKKGHVLNIYMPMRYCSLCSDSRSQKLWGFMHGISTGYDLCCYISRTIQLPTCSKFNILLQVHPQNHWKALISEGP